jgi:hypothetical protein
VTATSRAWPWATLGLAVAATSCTKDFDGLLGDAATGGASSAASSLATGGTGPGAGGTAVSSATTGGGAATGGAGTGGSAAGGSGGGMRACNPGNADQFVDDFQDGVATGWVTYASGSASVQEAQGKLKLHASDTTGIGNYAGYTSAAAFDLRGCRVIIHALDVPDEDVKAYFGFGDSGFANAVAIGADAETISFCNSVAGVADCVDEPHTLADDAWWRVRADATELLLETSPDALQWTVRRTITPLPAYVSSGYVDVGAGSSAPVEGSHDAAFDDFNQPP